MKFMSIAIPTYGYNGRGTEFLMQNLESIEAQTYDDYEVVISDHSTDDTILSALTSRQWKFPFTYTPCDRGRGKISPNLNNAISKCTGQYVKVLFQDDFLISPHSLGLIASALTLNRSVWSMTHFLHTNDGKSFYNYYTPKFTNDIWTGNNLMGCPSGLTFRRKYDVKFDESLNMLMDVDYYYRMWCEFGLPHIVEEPTYANRTWGSRLTDTIPQEEIQKERQIVYAKYSNHGHWGPYWI